MVRDQRHNRRTYTTYICTYLIYYAIPISVALRDSLRFFLSLPTEAHIHPKDELIQSDDFYFYQAILITTPSVLLQSIL